MGAQYRDAIRWGPTFHGPRVKWYKPEGLLLIAVVAAWRFFVTGKPLWGRGDNATWLHDATVDHRGKPVEKLSRARWRRVAWRWALIGVPWALADLALAARAWPDAAVASVPWDLVLVGYAVTAGTFATAYAARLTALWWPRRALRKAYVYPVWSTLCRVAGVKYHRRDALASIGLPHGFPDKMERPVRVYLPASVPLDGKRKDALVDAIGPRLGLPGATAVWTEAGVERAYVDLSPMTLPPETVTLDALMPELLASPLAEPVVGVAAGGAVIHMDFRNDSPHSLGSAGSGAGKSTLYKWISMQRLRHPNTYAIILDFKKWSHLRWAGRLPAGRVLIEDEIPRIHDVLCKVLDELLWRKSFDLHQEAELEALPTIDVYVEEINTLMPMLGDYWREQVAQRKQAARTAVRLAKDSGDPDAIEQAEAMMGEAMGLPVRSPALQALKYGVNLGREFHVHFHFIGQSVSATAAGGRDTRESFRTRFLAGWDRKTWKMLADGTDYIVCPDAPVGLWAHVHGSVAEIVRVPYVRDEDAVAYVTAGPRPSRPMFHGDPVPSVDASGASAIASALPLSAIADILPLKANGDRMTINALRLAASRGGDFPEPVPGEYAATQARLYRPDEVLAWFRERERLAVGA